MLGGHSEYNRIINCQLANQRAPKAPFTCVVHINCSYLLYVHMELLQITKDPPLFEDMTDLICNPF